MPQDCQSWASTLFRTLIREGRTDPHDICREAALTLRARFQEAEAEGDGPSQAKLLKIWRCLIDEPVLALAFAVDCLEWEALPEEEKERRRAESARQFREQLKKNQAARLQALAESQPERRPRRRS